MLLNRWYDGVEICREDKIIFARFLTPHRVISTCPVFGGLQDDLEYLYNHQSCEPSNHHDALRRITSIPDELYLAQTAECRGLPKDRCASLGTAANMRCAAVCAQSFRALEVIAVCTGGVETNGGRAGDPATVYEHDGRFESQEGTSPTPGTVNVMLFINRELTKGAMVRAVITAAEAKTSALQELSVPSRYSSGLATGTGTDQTGIASRLGDKHPLTAAGKHTKLGELIGRTVHDAVKEALAAQNGMTPMSRCKATAHLERFGADESRILSLMRGFLSPCDAALLKDNFSCLDRDPVIAAAVVALVHLRDQLAWEVLPKSCAVDILSLFAAQIAVSVSGRCDKLTAYRSALYPRGDIFENEHFIELICRAAAAGFADKWRFESGLENAAGRQTDC